MNIPTLPFKNKYKMIFKYLESDLEVEDKDFDLIYPSKIKAVAATHFTPVKVSKIAAFYLADRKGVKVLDIGAGAGKFCMIGSACTDGYFTGIEQRKTLWQVARRISKRYNLTNVKFINANIIDISFKDFDAFYFFNAFYENISILGKINDEIELSRELYEKYSDYVKEQLDLKPIGTKLVTYYSFLNEVPDSYKVQFSALDDKLKFWQKMC